MPEVAIDVPPLLRDAVGGAASVSVSAGTLPAALAQIPQRWPALAALVLDDANAPRPHVLILHNGKLTRGVVPPPALKDGDRLAIVQAISGG